MNEVNVLLADNPNFKFVECVFYPFTGSNTYTYKTLDPAIEEEDFVVVETPSKGFQVVQVRAIKSPLEVNLEEKFEFKWTVQRICTESYEKCKTVEGEIRKVVNTSRNKRGLEEARKAVLEGLDDETAKAATALVRL